MPHFCELSFTDLITQKLDESGIKSKLMQTWLKLVLISENHVETGLYFRSSKAIREEKLRHIASGFLYVIHPLSTFRKWYEFWLLWYYLAVVYGKAMDIAITKIYITDFHRYVDYTIDFLAIIDISVNLFTGYTIKKSKKIELRPKLIAKRYLRGPFFFSDVLGSTKLIIYYILPFEPPLYVIGIQNLLSLSRVMRIWSVIQLLSKESVLQLTIKSRTTTFAICSVTLLLFTMHFFTCCLIGSKLLVRYYFQFPDPDNASSINAYEVYTAYMYRSTTFLLGAALPTEYYMEINYVEDYATTVFVYLIGKILVISTWIIFALCILASKSTTIKYQKIMNELDEYMIQKQLPLALRKKINAYYHYKYQGKYFREKIIHYILPDNLRKDVDLGITKSLVTSVSIFRNLSTQQISETVQLMIPEIYLPNDSIMQAGTVGDSMFFVSSGTVAVYTHSGKELCHLHEGAYFGEISLVLKGQRRTATVNAVEYCYIYRLKKSDFKRTLMKNRGAYRQIVELAETRLKQTAFMEKMYKKALFEKTYTESDTESVM